MTLQNKLQLLEALTDAQEILNEIGDGTVDASPRERRANQLVGELDRAIAIVSNIEAKDCI
jgi:hypothetical protein